MKKLIIVAVVLFGIAGFGSQAKAWSCAETHYSCSAGTSGNKSESSSKWTWTCSDEAGSVSCSEKKPVEKIIIKEVPVEKIVIKEVPVEKLVTVEKIVEVPVEKIVKEKEIIYKKKIVYKDRKKPSVEKKTLPKTGLPLAGLIAVALGTVGTYGTYRKLKK
ncbi:MAG: hypothetical protein AAB487_02565 [Patescibacteria group bacterium]